MFSNRTCNAHWRECLKKRPTSCTLNGLHCPRRARGATNGRSSSAATAIAVAKKSKRRAHHDNENNGNNEDHDNDEEPEDQVAATTTTRLQPKKRKVRDSRVEIDEDDNED